MAFSVQKSDLTKLANKTVIVTGGSSGIGLATAQLFLSLSCNVVIFDRQPPIQPIAATYQQCDISSFTSQRAAFNKVVDKYGVIDIVFANAGIGEARGEFLSMEEDADGLLKDLDHKVINIDIRATADTVRLACYHMRKSKKGGSIICTASLAGYLATIGIPMYSAAKHGVVGMMRSLKNEVKNFDIAISVLAPATVITPLLVSQSDEKLDRHVATMAQSGISLSKAESPALAVAWLANKGMEANGMGVLVQSDRMMELESGLAKTRKIWFGEEMLGYFKAGNGADHWKKNKL